MEKNTIWIFHFVNTKLPIPLSACCIEGFEAIFKQIYPHAFDVLKRIVDPIHGLHVEIEELLIAPANLLPQTLHIRICEHLKNVCVTRVLNSATGIYLVFWEIMCQQTTYPIVGTKIWEHIGQSMDFAVSLLHLEFLSSASAEKVDYHRWQNMQEQRVDAVHERRLIYIDRQIVHGIWEWIVESISCH